MCPSFAGMKLFGTTSLVGTSFTAYLTEKQIEQFSKDTRVELITQDAYLTPSALWNSTNDNYPQVRPWGLHAMEVAWAGPSNGSATVYVLDTGVEMHADLPGLAAGDRLSALPGINPTGCYAHSTHVAGIIGAADNGTGVVGVLPGVKIVSIALGTTNSTTTPCPLGSSVGSGSHSQTTSALGSALQKVYERAIYDQKVAVVNISFNRDPLSPTNEFSSTGTIGQKMREVATSSFYDGAGYRGAFIVQSAGNLRQNACNHAFDAPAASDGIMVVGGLDQNGQEVVPMQSLGLFGFSSMPFAGDEPGSNTNAAGCVEVWAPSQRVYSTWSGGYQFLSGTSMAAPHIAGFAARLVESNPGIQTSDQLETAVRGYFTAIAGLTNLSMPRMSLQSVIAAPTLEMVDGTSRSSLSPINFVKFAAQVDLKYEAIGAQYCVANVTKDGAPHLNDYTLPSHNLGVQAYSPGQYVWTVTCYSPQGTQTTVVANGHLKRPVTVAWRVSTTSTGATNTTPSWQPIPNGNTVMWSASASPSAPFDQIHESTGADWCHIQTYAWNGNSNGDPVNPVYSMQSTFPPYYAQTEPPLWDIGPVSPTYYQHATFYFGSNPQPSYVGYKWLLTCGNSDESKRTVMYGRPQ